VHETFELLEEPVPEDFQLTLHILSRDELEQLGVCSEVASGCAKNREGWSSARGSDLHELTHLVMFELAPPVPASFAEGIAETIGASEPHWPESIPRLSLASHLTDTTSELDAGERISAALYASFLLEEFGPQAYLDLYRSLPRGASLDEADARMREHLGTSLDALDVEFLDPAEARCTTALSYCGNVYGPVLEPPFELEQSLACDEPGVLGYTAEDGSRHPIRHWQVEIPRDGSYWVEAEGAVISVLRCGSCEERELFAFNGTALMEGGTFELEAGLYTLEVRELLEGHDTFRLVLREG
jgi:hypothetical protein